MLPKELKPYHFWDYLKIPVFVCIERYNFLISTQDNTAKNMNMAITNSLLCFWGLCDRKFTNVTNFSDYMYIRLIYPEKELQLAGHEKGDHLEG